MWRVRSFRRAGAGAIALALLAAAGWVGWQRLQRPRNVILITIDTMRSDRLSSYGYRLSQTPSMDRLATEGVRFALAYCDIPWTTGSLASTMTGTFGPRHGVTSPTSKLPADRTTMAEVLLSHGYSTGAVLASFATDSAYHLDQGFQSYDDNLNMPVFLKPGKAIEKVDMSGPEENLARQTVDDKIANDGYRSDASVTDAAIAWLEKHRDGGFFLWVHYFGPHERFVLDAGVNHRQRVIDDYDPDTRATDTQLGRFLDRLDQWKLTDDTLVILHSDHGQAMREYGLFGHGHDLHEESVRIPMLMRLPGRIRAGEVVETLVRNVDIFPTVLDYLGIELPANVDGRSLLPAIRGDTVPDVPAYMELIDAEPLPVPMVLSGMFYGSATWHGMRLGRWKYMNVRLNSPCVLNPKRYAPFGFLDVNPKNPVGATAVADADCGKPLRQDLFEADGLDYIDERITVNKVGAEKKIASDLAARVKQVQAAGRDGENFKLDPEQERKLKSLGYLR